MWNNAASACLIPRMYSSPYCYVKLFGSILFDNHGDKLTMLYNHMTSLYIMLSRLLMCVLQAVKKGDTIFIGQYLFTGSETTSVWLEVGGILPLPDDWTCFNRFCFTVHMGVLYWCMLGMSVGF